MSDGNAIIPENEELVPQKTAKQLEKEIKKQAKLDKLKQKLEKQNTAPIKKETCEVGIFYPHVSISSMYNFSYFFIRKKKRRKN